MIFKHTYYGNRTVLFHQGYPGLLDLRNLLRIAFQWIGKEKELEERVLKLETIYECEHQIFSCDSHCPER